MLERRFIGIFPALPLEKNLELGDWIIGAPEPSTPWAPTRFRELSEKLVRSFEKRKFKDGALLWHRVRGFDGSIPSDHEIVAIRAAVTFAVLDANDRLRLTEPDDGNTAAVMATMENADLFIQPISEDDGGITHRRGGALKSNVVGGLKIGGDPPPLADAVEPIRMPVPASRKLARAIFDAVLLNDYDKPQPNLRRIGVAIEWHASALANAPAVTMSQRLIALKTAFEALFDESNSRKCARKLRRLFEDVTRHHRDLLPWTGLLWRPDEKEYLWRWFWRKGDCRGVRRDGDFRCIEARSEIEDWFMTLADARNDVIHRGLVTQHEYLPPQERPQSAYVGHLFWVGERVLREAIKAQLGPEVLLCGAIASRKFAVKTFGPLVAEWRKNMRGQELPPPPTEAAARSLKVILSTLGCPAANLLTVDRAPNPHPIPDDTGAAYTYPWRADYRRNDYRRRSSMLITTAERDLLKESGAEDHLSDFWDRCE
jgi:hypothetical protein